MRSIEKPQREPDFARLKFTVLEQARMFALLNEAEAACSCVLEDNSLSQQSREVCEETIKAIKAFNRQMGLSEDPLSDLLASEEEPWLL